MSKADIILNDLASNGSELSFSVSVQQQEQQPANFRHHQHQQLVQLQSPDYHPSALENGSQDLFQSMEPHFQLQNEKTKTRSKL
ncbi:hypothetical protein BGZ83_006940 [Gryganskiella cystojenkinii]|nr:hypothetical protein BGZ83_006940 [Gryganskiella cystojenkinii]